MREDGVCFVTEALSDPIPNFLFTSIIPGERLDWEIELTDTMRNVTARSRRIMSSKGYENKC